MDTVFRESTDSWATFLRNLKKRGMNAPIAIIGDGHLGIWQSVGEIFPESEEKRCWNNKSINVLDKLPKKKHAAALEQIKKIPYAKTKADATGLKNEFKNWCINQNYLAAAENIEHDWERMTTFFLLPQEHWIHLRTTNIIESPFSALRIRTNASKRYKKAENATAVIWKMMMVLETRFNKLYSVFKMREVFAGGKYKDGILVVIPKARLASG